jgi:hypothetical protein
MNPKPVGVVSVPLLSESGTYETVKDRFLHWLSGSSPKSLETCSLFAEAVSSDAESVSPLQCLLRTIQLKPRSLDPTPWTLIPKPYTRNRDPEFWILEPDTSQAMLSPPSFPPSCVAQCHVLVYWWIDP